MPTPLGALREDNVSVDIDGISDMTHVVALTDEHCTRVPNFIGEGTRITKRQHDSCRPILENIGQQ